MRVYGDVERSIAPRHRVRAIAQALEAVEGKTPRERHAAWVGALVDASAVAQAILDDHADARGGEDHLCSRTLAAHRWILAIARGVAASTTAGATPNGAILAVRAAAADLAAHPLPASARARSAEGSTHYAVYPEAYVIAATRALAEGRRASLVVGIRSIGVGLGAAVAASFGDADLVTVRPRGDPFRRSLAVGGRLARALDGHARASRVAVVDEGPGLSGSSFGAALDALEGRGASRDRLDVYPSHDGDPGAFASGAERARWRTVRRHVVSFEEALVDGPPHLRLARFAEAIVGPLDAPLRDVGGGRWREHVMPPGRAWPPVFARQERRKYLARASGATFLLRFGGLGREGEERLARARALADARIAPPLRGAAHGFFVFDWLAGATPFGDPREGPRDALLDALGAHLSFLATRFPVPREEGGASPAALLDMAKTNAAEALGEEHARALDAWGGDVRSLVEGASYVATDNKLHPWEWLLLPDGSVRKTDAVDHHAGHDLVGAQDVAWDIAGARVELALDDRDLDDLLRRVAFAAGARRAPSPRKLRFYEIAYLAFELGRAALARSAVAPDDGDAPRLDAAKRRYAALLREAIESTGADVRPRAAPADPRA